MFQKINKHFSESWVPRIRLYYILVNYIKFHNILKTFVYFYSAAQHGKLRDRNPIKRLKRSYKYVV